GHFVEGVLAEQRLAGGDGAVGAHVVEMRLGEVGGGGGVFGREAAALAFGDARLVAAGGGDARRTLLLMGRVGPKVRGGVTACRCHGVTPTRAFRATSPVKGEVGACGAFAAPATTFRIPRLL